MYYRFDWSSAGWATSLCSGVWVVGGGIHTGVGRVMGWAS